MENMSNDEGQQGSQGGMRHQYISRPKICQFCVDKNAQIDYKQVDVMRRYVMEGGKIRPRRQTGNCAHHQRVLARAIKRARHIALLPYASGGYEDRLH